MSKPNATVSVGDVRFGNDAPLAIIAGPCQLESRQHAFDMAGSLKELAGKLGFGLVYKTSYDKANRTSLSGRRGATSTRKTNARSSRRMWTYCRYRPS
jgi:2-dehydro-3-deoxyphosphooctonate aldolase (KDO 8-P synthase)